MPWVKRRLASEPLLTDSNGEREELDVYDAGQDVYLVTQRMPLDFCVRKVRDHIVNATVYQKYTIPIQDLSRQRAEESVGKMIANYSEEVEWDDTMGTIEINGSKHLPYNKQLWFPQGESGTPEFELVSPEGHNLTENDMLTWFFNALKRSSNN